MALKASFPNISGDDVGVEVGIVSVGGVQSEESCIPIVRKQNHAVHPIHVGLGIADAALGGAGIEHIRPLVVGQGAPHIGRVATVANRVVAPVGVAVGSCEVIFIVALSVGGSVAVARVVAIIQWKWI